MTKDDLIVKQQLEIEELKLEIKYAELACKDARDYLQYAEQWSITCSDFPRVAMGSILKAMRSIEGI